MVSSLTVAPIAGIGTSMTKVDMEDWLGGKMGIGATRSIREHR
jgi:hypothetical protein